MFGLIRIFIAEGRKKEAYKGGIGPFLREKCLENFYNPWVLI